MSEKPAKDPKEDPTAEEPAKPKYFKEQFDDEEVLLVFRKHPIVMRKGLIFGCLALLLGKSRSNLTREASVSSYSRNTPSRTMSDATSSGLIGSSIIFISPPRPRTEPPNEAEIRVPPAVVSNFCFAS